MRRNSAAFAVLVGGLIAGALDITYAVTFSAFHGVPPLRLLQSVASGLLGAAAYEGGVPTAVLGLVLHFLLMLLIAAIFYFASRKLPALVQRAVLWGALYGFVVYWVMNLVVLPLSAFPGKVRFTSPGLLAINLFVHMFFIGLPIALAARKAAAYASAAASSVPST